MNRITDIQRTEQIINETIRSLNLDLSGMTVMTELASGDFIVTPLTAALAGAEKVYVTGRDSRYGTVEELKDYMHQMQKALGICDECIQFVDDKDRVAQEVNVVTNSGFVRPINDGFIKRLPEDAAISLMFESWEYRPEDIDLGSCRRNNIPILGVNENDDRLRIFRYVGLTVLKLLFELQIEVFKGRFLVLSSGSYLKEIKHVLEANGAEVFVIDTSAEVKNVVSAESTYYDAIIVAEQDNPACLIGEGALYTDLVDPGRPLIHIAGVLDGNWLKNNGINKYPPQEAGYGYMTVTTGYMGIRPVIELNAAGLRVGQLLVEGMRTYHNVTEAQRYALGDSCAMDFDMQQ